MQIVQVGSITTSLLSAGALFAFNFFDIPILQAQPASRSMPATRWFFSRGSHIFPQAALLASSGFTFLAYTALPTQRTGMSLIQLLKYGRVPGYIAAAILAIGIAPFTPLAMIPYPNFDIIQLNKDLGGAASQKQASLKAKDGTKESKPSSGPPDMDGSYSLAEFKDLSLPMEKTERDSTPEEDEKARELLGKFRQLNMVRAFLLLGGGVVGLATALA